MNRQQKRQAREKEKRHKEKVQAKTVYFKQKKLETKADIVVTFIYEIMLEKCIHPILKTQLRFGPVRMERFKEKLWLHERVDEMRRNEFPTYVNEEWVKRQRMTDESLQKVYDYTVQQARRMLEYMGYGETRLQRLFDPYIGKCPGWYELFQKGAGEVGGKQA